MIRLDVSTFGLASSIVAIACGLVLLTLCAYKKGAQGFLLFAAHDLLYGVGLIIVLTKGSIYHVNQGFVGNTIVIIASAFLHAGVLWLCGRRMFYVMYPIVSGWFAAFYYQFGFEPQDIATRITILCVAHFFFLGTANYFLIATRIRRGAYGVGLSMIILAVTLTTLVVIVRGVYVQLVPIPDISYYEQGGVLAFYYALTTICRIILTLALIIILNEATEDRLLSRIKAATGELIKEKEKAILEATYRRQFFAAGAHDLRQPAHALRLLITAIELDLEQDGENVGDLLNEARVSSDRMSKLLDDFLDINRYEFGSALWPREPHPLAMIFIRLSDQFTRHASANDCRLEIVIPVSVTIVTNADILYRTLSNLVSNAIKFSRGGTVLVGCRHRGNEIEIQVLDNGIGIAPDKLDAIFDPFVQLNNKARQGEKGSGLGLVIARKTAQVLGTDIKLTSTQGKGSVFSLRLPLVK